MNTAARYGKEVKIYHEILRFSGNGKYRNNFPLKYSHLVHWNKLSEYRIAATDARFAI
jgi:hypothetical protein